MTSFILISKDQEKRAEFLQTFYKKHSVDTLDVTIVGIDNSVKQNTQSIGIEDIKFMQKKLFLKPLRSGNKAVVLDEAQLLTIEAQNALLKVLEEPPPQTLIILSADSKETFLPTIISRCFVIDLGEETQIFSEKETNDIETFLSEFPQWGIGERLKKAEQLAKDKDKAIVWIGKTIIVAREKLIANVALDTPDTFATLDTLRRLQSLHTLLKTTNVNPRFAIENTLLNPL